MKIILASQSPRRRELLAQMGLEFIVKAPQVEESVYDGLPPIELVETLSRVKAAAAAADREDLVIAADTVVVQGGRVLGKPGDREEAIAMLTALSGGCHQVYTGITVRQGEMAMTRWEQTQVTFRPLSPEEITAYVNTGEPMDKAGAYGIQGLGALLVEGIQGDYCNVVGLPIHRLGGLLRHFGVDCLARAAERASD